MERIWRKEGEAREISWEELKKEIQGILREGQGLEKGRKEKRGWWDGKCKELKKRSDGSSVDGKKIWEGRKV